MKGIIAGIVMLSLSACAGMPIPVGIVAPEFTEISYKDIVSCKPAEGVAGFIDCKVADPDSGLGLTIRFKKGEVPTEPTVE